MRVVCNLFLTFLFLLTSFCQAGDYYLTTSFAESINQGYGKTLTNRSIDGNPLHLDGKAYPNGIGTHANGEIIFQLHGAANTFSAVVGVDDETNKRGSVIFKVLADGKERFVSPVIKGGNKPITIHLDIKGVRKLQLICDGTADHISYDHADWADAKISTTNKDLITRIQDTKLINYLNIDPDDAIQPLRQKIPPLSIKSKDGNQALSFFPAAGVYDILAGDEKITNAHVIINGEEALRNAKTSANENSITATSRFKAFQIKAQFNQFAQNWLSLQLSVKNTSKSPHKLYNLYYLISNTAPLLNQKKLHDLSFFSDSYSIWDKMPGHQKIRNKQLDSKYIAVIFHPDFPQAWSLGFLPPQDWPGTISVNGDSDSLMAYIDLFGKPFILAPQEEITLDRMVISGRLPLIDSLQAYGKAYHPHTDLNKAEKIHGYNSWEFFKGDINAKNMGKALQSLKKWPPAKNNVTYFILDNGWKNSYGDWTFNASKWPQGPKNWTQQVENAGMIPGIWLAPFWTSPELAKKFKLRAYPQNRSEGLAKLRVRIDPSDPNLKKRVCNQIRALRDQGFLYFKTDFLFDVYKGNRNYKFSKFAPERVMRDFMQAMRNAMGEDAFWLACGTAIAPCAGLVDASRVGMDIKADWNWLRNTIIRRNAPRFWMHGNLWLNDQDFLIVRGPQSWMKGYEKPLAVDVPAKGFTPAEAQTWCAYIVISGGPAIWSDHPQGINPSGLDLVARTLKHAGGHGGIPLDIERTNLPSRWVRRENDRIYLALFNWDNHKKKLAISSQNVPELKNTKAAVNIFNDQSVQINNGRLEADLDPHHSLCVLIPTL